MSLMNYKTALEILEIDMSEKKYSDVNLEYLKKQYHKLALQNHPDKNGNTKESKEKFQAINEAYDYLKREINFKEKDEKSTSTSTIYVDILQSFLSEIFAGKYNDQFYEVVKKNAALFDSKINYERDFYYDYFGFKTLEKSYLLRIDGKIVERP